MTRPLHLALALLLAAGCTFERRPAVENGGAEIDTAASGVEATGLGVSPAQTLDEARAFIRTFQDARREGRISEIRSLLHPRALLIHGSGRLSPGASDAEVEALLVGRRGEELGPATVEEVEHLSPGVLAVLRYPPRDSVSAVETLLLLRDSSGWSVRLLQRTRETPG